MKQSLSIKILIIAGIVFFIFAIIMPWYLTQPVGIVSCDILYGNPKTNCYPPFDVFVFFGLMAFFTAIGMLLIYVAIVNSGKKPSRKAKRQI